MFEVYIFRAQEHRKASAKAQAQLRVVFADAEEHRDKEAAAVGDSAAFVGGVQGKLVAR